MIARRSSASRASALALLAAIALILICGVAIGRSPFVAAEEAPKAGHGAGGKRHHTASAVAAALAGANVEIEGAEEDDAPPSHVSPHHHHQHDQAPPTHSEAANHHAGGHEAHAHAAHGAEEGAHDASGAAIEHGHHFAAEKPSIASASSSASSSKHHRREGPLPASPSTPSAHDHHAPTTQQSLFPGGCEPRVPTGNHPLEFSIRCLSPSVALAPGKVVNVNLLFESPFPADVAVAIGAQTTQLVSAETREPIPADDVYMHHFVTPDTLLVPPPTGQGNVTRATFFVDVDAEMRKKSARTMMRNRLSSRSSCPRATTPATPGAPPTCT